MIKNDQKITHWYLEPWPWFLLAIFFSAFLSCVAMIFFSIKYADDTVIDHYYKEGLSININLSEAENAKNLAIKAVLSVFPTSKTIQIRLKGSLKKQPRSLLLKILSPTRKKNDQLVIMRKLANNLYSGFLSKPISGRYYIILQSHLKDIKLTEGNGKKNLSGWQIQDEVNFTKKMDYTLAYP